MKGVITMMKRGFNGINDYGRLAPMTAFSIVGCIIAFIILVALIVIGVILIRKYLSPSRKALLILNERLAKGEIEPEDYTVKRDLLLPQKKLKK